MSDIAVGATPPPAFGTADCGDIVYKGGRTPPSPDEDSAWDAFVHDSAAYDQHIWWSGSASLLACSGCRAGLLGWAAAEPPPRTAHTLQ